MWSIGESIFEIRATKRISSVIIFLFGVIRSSLAKFSMEDRNCCHLSAVFKAMANGVSLSHQNASPKSIDTATPTRFLVFEIEVCICARRLDKKQGRRSSKPAPNKRDLDMGW